MKLKEAEFKLKHEQVYQECTEKLEMILTSDLNYLKVNVEGEVAY